MKEIPEFTAYEMNELTKRARGNAYYSGCLLFILNTVLNDTFDTVALTEKQVRWLWGIKRDLKND